MDKILKRKLNSLLIGHSFLGITLGIMSIIFFIQADRRFGYTSAQEKENVNIISDGTGYYAYLPQHLIYSKSKNYSFISEIENKYPAKKFGSMLKKEINSQERYNKFYVGTAILQSPFFLIAHGIQKISSGDADGYSLTYRLWLNISSIFYWLIGCLALFRLFGRMGYSRIQVFIGIVFISFGTNLNYYVAYYPSYSHVYSFALISWFLHIAHKWAQEHTKNRFIILALLFALIAIVRPVNVLIILILPFFFSSFKEFIHRLKTIFSTNKIDIVFSIAVFSLIIFIQLVSNYNQTGHWSLYTYANEGFSNALNPQFFNVLFSYEKGLFVYAPILLLTPIGIYFLIKKHSRYFVLGWFLTVLITLYFISSWWSWTYGGGLGMRALIEFFPLYLFPILAILAYVGKFSKWIVLTFGLVTVFLYQTFQIQFNRNIIAYSGMNKSKFWEVFMKTDGRYGWMLDYKYDKLPLKHGQLIIELNYQNNNWKISKDLSNEHLKISLEKEKIILHADSVLPKYARLSGEVAIHDPANNPTMNAEFYSQEKLIKLHEQPFGNKISTVGKFAPIVIDFNIYKVTNANQIVFDLKQYGERNSYKNFKLTIFD